MQVFSISGLTSVSEGVGTKTSSSESVSFADTLKTNMKQKEQTDPSSQKSEAISRVSEEACSADAENPKPTDTENPEPADAENQDPNTKVDSPEQGAEAGSDEKTEASTEAIINTPEAVPAIQEQEAAEDKGTEEISDSDEEEEPEPQLQPEPEMIYLSPYLLNNMINAADSGASAEMAVSTEMMPSVTDVTEAGQPVSALFNSGEQNLSTEEQNEFVLSESGGDDTQTVQVPEQIAGQNHVQQLGNVQAVSAAEQPGVSRQPKTSQPGVLADAINDSVPSEGENLISRIAEAMLQQEGGTSADTGGETSEETAVTQTRSADEAKPAAEDELPVTVNSTGFTVQVEDGADGKAAAVSEIIDRFTQDFQGAESCPGEINITLTPEELGELKISVHVTESGGVSAHIISKDKDICSLISGQIGRLIEAMESKGVTVEDVDVIYQQLGENQNGQDSFRESRGEQGNARYYGADQTVDAESEDTAVSAPEQYVNTRVISTGNSLNR